MLVSCFVIYLFGTLEATLDWPDDLSIALGGRAHYILALVCKSPFSLCLLLGSEVDWPTLSGANLVCMSSLEGRPVLPWREAETAHGQRCFAQASSFSILQQVHCNRCMVSCALSLCDLRIGALVHG